MQSWFSEAKAIPSLQAEVCFQIQEAFYYGPDRFSDASGRERLVDKLIPPRIQLATPSLVRTSEALGQERELAEYYQQIVRMAHHYKRPFNSIRQYFWLRLWLWNSECEVHVSFPWYDSLSEIDRFLAALVETDSGLVHHDMDQGWELQTYAHDGLLYFQERDPDADETHLIVSAPRVEFIDQVMQLRERAKSIVAQLSGILGADVWTAYVRTEPAFNIERP
jgi:hypothetical protein